MKKFNTLLLKFASRCLSICLLTTIGTINLTIYTSNYPVFAQPSDNPKQLEAAQSYLQGLKLLEAKQFTEAIAPLERAIVLYQELGDRYRQGKIILALAHAYRKLERYEKALDLCQQSLKIAQASADKKEIDRGLTLTSSVWFEFGVAEARKGNTDRALKAILTARSFAQQVNNQKQIGIASIHIGSLYTDLADYPAAIQSFDLAIGIFQKLVDPEKIASTLLLQGDAYLYSSQYTKALSNYESGLKTSREIKSQTVEVAALQRLGGVYDSLGQYQQAAKIGEESLILARKVGDKAFEAISLNGLGASASHLKKYPEAQAYLEQALEIYRSTNNRAQAQLVLANLAKIYYQTQQYDKSLDYYQQAFKDLDDKRLASSILSDIGDIYYRQGNNQLALNNYQQGATLARSINALDFEGIALTNQGKVLYTLGKLPAAETQLRAAIKIWESLRTGLSDKNKVSFADTIVGSYQLLQKVLIEQNKIPAALEISERARARALAELLASKIAATASAKANKIRQAPNLSQIQQVAQAQAATLVQYSIINDSIYTWVIKPTGKISFYQTKLPPKTTLKDLVVTTRDSIGANRGSRSKDNDAPTATGGDLKQLHQLLIKPIVKDLPTNPEQRVIILPQNELFLVPFAALQDAQGKYLIEQHTLTISPSIQVLALTNGKTNRTNNHAPLVVGNPVMPLYKGQPLDNLAGAEAEANAVAQILQVKPLIGAQADKQQVIQSMQQAPMIHLATHGLLDTIAGDIPGAIALTNGFLTSGEIFDMQLKADLVVLSACDTGRGDVTGDGVVGLSRSLSVAGVPSVLVSLWEVSDKATKALMEEFYQNLHVKKLTKAQALRQAMLTTMKDYPNPNFWAAFMLVGEGR
jgi:CHAT domain-containing protein/predicted negative regulator of RcsB-dependent stress response